MHHIEQTCKSSNYSWRYNAWKGADPTDRVLGATFAADYLRQLDRLTQIQPELLKILQYDAIYIDEGQDIFDNEYRILMRLLKTNPKTGNKNIVIAYDDAQNLYGRPRPTWIDLGIQVSGGRAYPMKLCHRNPREIVEFAFNVLLGAPGRQTRHHKSLRRHRLPQGPATRHRAARPLAGSLHRSLGRRLAARSALRKPRTGD